MMIMPMQNLSTDAGNETSYSNKTGIKEIMVNIYDMGKKGMNKYKRK